MLKGLTVGEAIRNNGGGYPHGLPIAAVECKEKGGNGPLDETRQTLARLYDLALVTQPWSGCWCRIFETRTYIQWGVKSSKYVSFFQKGTFAIVRAGVFQAGAGTLAAHYSIRHLPGVYSNSTSISSLQSSFRQTLAEVAQY